MPFSICKILYLFSINIRCSFINKFLSKILMSNLLNSLNSFISNKVFTKLLFPIKLILSMNSLYLKQNCIIKRDNYLFEILTQSFILHLYFISLDNNIDKSLWKIHAFNENRNKNITQSLKLKIFKFNNNFFFS